MKKCNACKMEKKISEFTSSQIKLPWGRCKSCWSLRNKKYNREVRTQVLEAYGNKCNCCGESKQEFLAIDHINGGGYKQRKTLSNRSSTGLYMKLREWGYPEGYRVLCHNCNQSRGFYGYCPHDKITIVG